MQKKLTVLFAFAIFVLIVGWSITPAQAHPGTPDNCPHKDGHQHCSEPPPDGGGKATFSIDVLAGIGGVSPFVVAINCGGITSVNLSSHFPISSGCGEVLIEDETLTLFLTQIAVNNTKKETTATFFLNGTEGFPALSETEYRTDALQAVVEAPSVEGASFQIRVVGDDRLDENLTKLAQPDKGKVVGTISFGTIVYTPIP